jgi:hypothetical protein
LKTAVHKRVLLLASSTQQVERCDFWFGHDKGVSPYLGLASAR